MEIKVLNFTNSKTYAEVETGIPMDYYQNVDDNFGNPKHKAQTNNIKTLRSIWKFALLIII